jgi:hypothetical protein
MLAEMAAMGKGDGADFSVLCELFRLRKLPNVCVRNVVAQAVHRGCTCGMRTAEWVSANGRPPPWR